MKPGTSRRTTTGRFPAPSRSARARRTVAALVAGPQTTSTRGSRSGGFQKCMPQTRSGWASPSAIAPMDSPEELVPRSVVGGVARSSAAKSIRFIAKCSAAASTTSSGTGAAARAASSSACTATRAAAASTSAAVSNPAATSAAHCVRQRSSAVARTWAAVSTRLTWWPARAKICAMPAPINPAPTTSTWPGTGRAAMSRGGATVYLRGSRVQVARPPRGTAGTVQHSGRGAGG